MNKQQQQHNNDAARDAGHLFVTDPNIDPHCLHCDECGKSKADHSEFDRPERLSKPLYQWTPKDVADAIAAGVYLQAPFGLFLANNA